MSSIDKMPTRYDVGTASVEAGSTAVTNAGGFWFGNVWGDDLFWLPSQPLVPPQRMESVDEEGVGTLAYPWPGVDATDEPYEIRYVGMIERSTAQSRRVLEQLGDVKAWYDVIVADDTARLALETEGNPLPANRRVLVKDDGAIWAKKTSAYGDWIGPVEFRGDPGAPGTPGTNGTTPIVTASATTLAPGAAATAAATPITGGVNIELGVPAGRSAGIPYNWSTTTTDADPGAGLVRANNASLASATTLFVSKTSAAGSSMAAFLLALAASTSADKGTLVLTRVADGATATLKVTAVTDATNYVKVTVSGHSGATALTNNGAIDFLFTRTGDQGAGTPADGSITNAKLADMAQATYKGRAVGAGTGAPSDLTAAQVRAGLGVREVLSANRTYYVRTDGSDSNTGLANTSGGAFLTLQKAVDVAVSLDLSIYSININVADGTYTTGAVLKPYIGVGPINIIGNVTTPANVLISSAATCIDGTGGSWTVDGVKLQNSASGFGVISSQACDITVKRVNFGACVSGHIVAASGGKIYLVDNYTISGASVAHFYVIGGGQVVANSALTVTLIGTPAFATSSAAFLTALGLAYLSIANITWSGAATGKRYDVINNSVAMTGGKTLPGSVAGTVATGGQYS